jgi:hypothetical protein
MAIEIFNSAVADSVHADTGLRLDANGFHDLNAIVKNGSAYQSSRIIYLDSVGGNDGAATHHTRDDFADITQPSGGENAYRTLSTAFSQLQPGSADVLLIKRGSSFSSFEKPPSGAGANGRLIVAGYGTGARPLFTMSSSVFMDNIAYTLTADLKVVGPEPSSNERFWFMTGSVSNHTYNLMENCWIQGWKKMTCQDQTAGLPSAARTQGNIFRRNIFYRNVGLEDGFGGAYGNSQAQFCYHVYELLFEQNIYIENGWSPTLGDSSRDQYSRHLYLDNCVRPQVHENVMIRPATEQIQWRANSPGDVRDQGTTQNNLMLDSGGVHLAATRSDFDCYVLDNVVMGDLGPFPDQASGWAIACENIASPATLFVQRNIIANAGLPTPDGLRVAPAPGSSGGPTTGTIDLQGNYIHTWGGLSLNDGAATVILGPGNKIYNPATSDDDNANCVTWSSGSSVSVFSSNGNEMKSERNGGAGTGFEYQGSQQTLTAWSASVGESPPSTTWSPPLTFPGIGDYMASLGLGASLANYQALLLTQDKDNWNSDLMANAANNYFRNQDGSSDLRQRRIEHHNEPPDGH